MQATEAAKALYERKKTDTLDKINEDVTRHRYGDDAHLDTTTKALGLVEPGRPYPILLEVKLGETSKGELSYAMVFNAPEAPFSLWADEKRVRKYETFFGPDIDAEVVKVDADKRVVAIVLATNGGTPGGLRENAVGVGMAVGKAVGTDVGTFVDGAGDGSDVGTDVGTPVGGAHGAGDGRPDGTAVGTGVGQGVCTKRQQASTPLAGSTHSRRKTHARCARGFTSDRSPTQSCDE